MLPTGQRLAAVVASADATAAREGLAGPRMSRVLVPFIFALIALNPDPQAFVSQLAQPPAVYSAGMAYDSGRSRLVVFGGFRGTYVGDTWEWDGSAWTRFGRTALLRRKSSKRR